MKLKNEAIVGVVALVGIVVAVIGAFWLSGKPWGEDQMELVGIFREVGELREGNPVKYRGVQVGRVTDIDLSETGRGVLVTLQVSPGIELPPSPAVLLAPASLFGDWQASIISTAAYPDLEFTEALEADVLPGATLPDITQLTAVGARIAEDLESLAGRVEVAFTEETAIKIRQTIENVAEISAQLSGFVEQQTEVYAQVSENVLVATENIQTATAEVQALTAQVEGAIDEGELEAIVQNVRLATQNLQQLTAQLDTITAEVPGLLGQLEVTLQAATRIVNQLEPAAAEVAPTLAEARQALAGLQRITTQLEEGDGTLGRLLEDPALYEETQTALAALRRLLADLQENPERYTRGVIDIF